MDSLQQLISKSDVVVIEGAGSPVALNLVEGDIANMPVARHANASVLMVGDIDRGGIFASLLGTVDLLDAADHDLVPGLVMSKFRGDLSLFSSGVEILED